MNKILTVAAMAVMMAGQASAGGAALEALGELSGPEAAVQAPSPEACREPGPGATIEEIIAWIRCVELPPPPAAQDGAGKRTLVHPKIRVSPVTAAWRDTMLVKFRKVSFETVRAAMSAAGARTWTFGENDGAYIVRLDIADAKAPAMAMALAAQPAVDAVEVNRTVYETLKGGPKAAAAEPGFYKLTRAFYQNGAAVPGAFVYSSDVIFYGDREEGGAALERVKAAFRAGGREPLKAELAELNSYASLRLVFSGAPVALYKTSGDGYRTLEEARAAAGALQEAYSAAGYTVLETQVKEAFGPYIFIIICARF